jgi:TOMM system kinase/cyclase fusion protein
MMDFYTVLDQVLTLLRQRGRVSYRALKRQFQLDDETLADLTAELLYAHRPVVEEEGSGLVWRGDVSTAPESPSPVLQPDTPLSVQDSSSTRSASPPTIPPHREAERRQLTVLFCDLVDSTALAGQLDPEDLREVVRAYQATCAEVIQQFEGYIAQYLGDGLLIYFGYPQAHEDDAQRAVRASLEMLNALQALNTRLEQDKGLRLAVRLGIHTGLVVVGDMGGVGRQEQLALGETPNIAARLQGLAEPDTVIISEATSQLIHGYFVCQALGAQALKGLAQPLMVYRVLHESGAQTRLDVAATRGLTLLVGREQEIGLLGERWQRATEGMGQVLLLTGEAGIGKSRLVQVLRDQIVGTAATCIECRCSSHTQHSALYPVIAHLERALAFTRPDTPADKLHKLEDALASYTVSLADMVPLLAALLSLPLSAHYTPLTLTPQRQRQKTLEALLTWLWQETDRHPVLFIVEDLHWVDPSTLEFLNLLVDQSPTARIMILMTCRQEFTPPWPSRAHLTPLTITRLPRPHVERMVASVARAKTLPRDVVQQIVAKTDGVPLFVEELTKTVLESALLREHEDHYELSGPLPALAIPATLQDSLMARLDRLSTVKTVAQLGATIGRQFVYDLLQAISPLDEDTLQQGLRQLVEAELLYQRGIPPQATYVFKHALIQDAAYQSLLRSMRQQYHQRIAQVLEVQSSELIETQPELLAHHYTEAGLAEQAIPYWQQAGQIAIERSANIEAISHLTKGLELLKTLPTTPEHIQRELALQISLAVPLASTKGWAVPEVEDAYARGRELCRHIGETPQLFPVLYGLRTFYHIRGELRTARELAEQLLRLAQQGQAPDLLLARSALGTTLFLVGELASTRAHLEQGLTLYNPQQYRSHIYLYSMDTGVILLGFVAWTLWFLGYPDQAQKRSQEVLTLAQELAHPYSLAWALIYVAWFHQFRREGQAAQARAEAAITLATEQGFAQISAWGTISRGWALAEQGKRAEGMQQMRQGQAALRAMGEETLQSWVLALLAEAHEKGGQAEEGLTLLAEALAVVDNNEEHLYEAELYRLKGELTLQQFNVQGSKFNVANPRSLIPNPQAEAEAEACFLKAIDIARKQQAKSLELRAAMSLARLWQHQGKRDAARQVLAEVYRWFTEGFDTADLQEAKALLEALG